MNDRDKFLRGLSKQRIEQLLALSRTKQAAAPEAERTIESVPRDGDLPVSFAQQRLWFISQFDRKATHYNIPCLLSLRGAIDVGSLQAAIDALFVRHEALRSTFVSVHGEPRVRLLDATRGLPLVVHDLRKHADPGAELGKIERAESAAPFDLAAGPLMRVRLIHLGDEDHVLLVSQHHIVSDGWSLGILAREVCELYRAKANATTPNLPPLAIQYPDYAAWQRKELTRERLAEHFDYWRAQLAGAPELLSLPADRPRPPRQSTVGAQVPIEIGARLTQSLNQLARTQGMSLYMVLLAAWGIVLSRLSGQDDVVIGSPSANRDRLEIEPLIGFFVNMLALRLNLAGNPTIAQLLAQVRESTLAAQQHQSVPFEQVVEELMPPRRLDATPIFQASLTWQNNKPARFDLPGVVVEARSQPSGQVKFDIELGLSEHDEKIVGGLNYACALFDAVTVERHRGYLLKTLEAMVGDVSRPLHEIDLLSDAERALVVSQFNATHSPYERSRLVHESFEEQARRSAGAAALSYRGQTLGYQELNRRANRIAHRLRELGVGPDDRVAICAPRSFEMVQGLLGILKAGGAYVPLDPNLPRERLAYMLEDAAPTLILAHSAIREALPDAGLRVLWLDADEEWAAQPEHDPERAGLTAQHLAYVIYTSGSTGRPKGVMIEHGGLSHYLQWALKAYGTAAGTHSVVSSPLAFDATVTSLYLPLLSGGCALLLQEHNEQEELEARLRSGEPLDLVKITPAHLHMLGERFRRDPPGVQPGCFVIGGEALSAQTVALWRQLAPRSRLVNEYGPTETVVGCASFEIAGDVEPEASTVPIGHPIANTQLYIVDRHLQPVPVGVAGELLIGGVQVARGYLNQPQLSAERFIEHPFDPAGGKVYRTGDLGRWRADGSIEYLGRNDFQVKLRGFRIELGEIEAQLQRCAGVREAVVLAREDRPGDKRLVAYVVAQEGAQLSVPALREALARTLAEYMLPGAFELLASLPLTANGKLDRQALPAPGAPAATTHTYEAPQGEVEQALARIWTELLGVERVGRHDHFFELGGHSLMAGRMLSKVQDELDLSLEFSSVFNHPTLAGFADSVLGAIAGQLSDSSDVDALIADITNR